MDELRKKYRRELLERKKLHNQIQELKGNIRVFMRWVCGRRNCRACPPPVKHASWPSPSPVDFNAPQFPSHLISHRSVTMGSSVEICY